MKYEIKHRFTGNVLYSANVGSVRECVEKAIKEGAYLQGAYLRGAYLRCAYLQGAYLRGAYLQGADLRGADLPNFSITPGEGEFIAYKKLVGGVIAKILIPNEAKRTSSLIGRKCRAEFVKVLELSNGEKQARSDRQGLIYIVGEIVRPDSFDPDIRVECTNGIHFFITRKEAEEYAL